MSYFAISIDLSFLRAADAPFSREMLPNLSFAVQQITEAVHRQWAAYAGGAPMPNGKVIHSRTGEYMRSILLRQVSEFSGEVYSDLPYARIIEDGAPQRDLKTILNSSLKVRTTKDGRRYLIIPFRWGTPNSVMGNNMPAVVHEWWKQGRQASAVTGTFKRHSGTGAMDIKTRKPLMVPGWRYNWGTRLGKDDIAGLGIGGKTAKNLEGMYNFRKPRAKSGASSHSQFITFRVMMEGSPGWIAPAREGLHPARTVADQFRPIAERAFNEALSEDMRRLLNGS